MSFVLGITGSIATGKSTAVEVFRKHNFPVVDGDLVAREIVEPGKPALAAISTHFGNDILNVDGTLNRKKLGQIVFNDSTKRRELDKLMDPFLRREIIRQIDEAKASNHLVIADIPLMFEGNYSQYMDQVAVVYIPEAVQVERLAKRDNLTIGEAQARVASQMSIETKKKLADVVFDNQGTLSETAEQIESWLLKNNFLK